MKIVFSRKGFDSAYGGAPSPILGGIPVSLPIPGSNLELTTYADRGLSDLVESATGGRLSGADACHDDPMFADGHCWLGQVGAAQGHLRNQHVGPGDVFLFFGLFADEASGERHHRFFGYMRVIATGSPETIVRGSRRMQPPRPHPHFSGTWHRNNAIWFGEGQTSAQASEALRLTINGERRWSRWRVPEWLYTNRPTYLGGDWRWLDRRTLDARGVWQEAVCDIGEAEEPRRWLDGILAEISG